MTCDRIRPLLSDYHDDALSAKQRDRVRAHVMTCVSCRAILESYDRLYATVRLASPPAPVDLRGHVYARIAQMESGRALSPFRPGLFGALRTTGGTAGLLAVLGGLVLAAMRLAGAPAPATVVASPQQVAQARTAVTGFVDAVGAGHTSHLPPAAQTAVASTRGALAGVMPMSVGKGMASGANVSVPVQLMRFRQGSPQEIAHMSVRVGSANATPVVDGIAPMGSPSPVPTLSAEDGLVYLHEYNDRALRNRANSPADVWFHAFRAGARPTVLATPAPGQLFTGVTAGLDGRTIAYAARGQNAAGGVFSLDPTTRRSSLILAVPDAPTGSLNGESRFVGKVQQMADGRLAFNVVDQTVTTSTLTIDITGSEGLRPAATPDPGSGWNWHDYSVAPNGHAIAWTEHPDIKSGIGVLDVITPGAPPVTETIGAGGHPVWSPNGAKLLYKSDRPAGLYVWSHGRSTRVVALTARELTSLGDFAWSPNGRYFAYVLNDLKGGAKGGVSTVWLGDSTTGFTWKSFEDRYIGPISWARLPATGGTAATAVAASAAKATAVAATATKAGARQGSPASPAQRAQREPVPTAADARHDNTDSPQNVVESFYNAINRHEYARAFGYITNMPGDRPDFRTFANGYATTAHDTLTVDQAAPYVIGANVNAATCVAVALTARHTDGTVYHFGGWYMVKSTSGQAPHYRGWRIVMDGTHVVQNASPRMPLQAQCAASAHTATQSSPLAAG